MAWQIDPLTGAYYDDSDAPIKLSTTESFYPSGNKNWLWIAAVFLVMAWAKGSGKK